MFKPFISYYDPRQKKFVCVKFPTYRELRKSLRTHLCHSARLEADFLLSDYEVTVIRSRRGEWGEWFETWRGDVKDNPILIKEGWM